MIYTIGKTKLYESYFEMYADNPEEFQKSGRSEGYSGGTVFKTPLEALTACPHGYSVYGVVADWDEDTDQWSETAYGARDLLRDAQLVKLGGLAEGPKNA